MKTTSAIYNDYPVHYDIDSEAECFGELEEKSVVVNGVFVDTVYVCQECGEEFASYQLVSPYSRQASDSVCGSWEVM